MIIAQTIIWGLSTSLNYPPGTVSLDPPHFTCTCSKLFAFRGGGLTLEKLQNNPDLLGTNFRTSVFRDIARDKFSGRRDKFSGQSEQNLGPRDNLDKPKKFKKV